MKKTVLAAAAGIVILTLSSCSHPKSLEDIQINGTDNAAELRGRTGETFGNPDDDFVSSDNISIENFKKEGPAATDEAKIQLYEGGNLDYSVFEHLTGEYEYLSDYGTGKLIIKKTAYGYDISDYESESSYRFLANSSNIETIENNRIYIKYPEQISSDDAVRFGYYVLEYGADEIDVYYGKSVPEETIFLYHAAKKTEIGLDMQNESSGISEYEYPSEFSMGDNLKTAIIRLALTYDHFDKDSVHHEDWKESFIASFIQNSRLSFDYLDMVSEKNNGLIRADELNYIQYSLTGTELDFSSYAGSGINRYDAASPLNYGSLSRYDYQYTDNGVVITASLSIGYDGTDSIQKREITAELVKNPYSCFDGYSVVTVSSGITHQAATNEGFEKGYWFQITNVLSYD